MIGRRPTTSPRCPRARRSGAGSSSAARRRITEALFDYRRQAPHAALMHPTDEHLLPWYVAAGAGHEGPALRLHDSVTAGCLGMDAYAFGAGAP